jgi:SEC-C motif-containing protein
MIVSGNAPCPCHSGARYKRCCRRFHLGKAPETPEELMRSRFAAYAIGEVVYVQETTDPKGPQFRADMENWAEELGAFCEQTQFIGLKILDSATTGQTGMVSFYASLRQQGSDASFGEVSHFTRIGGRWRYHSAKLN